MEQHTLTPRGTIQPTRKPPSRWWIALAAFVIPAVLVGGIGLLHGQTAPLADDWIFFSHFDHIPLLPGEGVPESAILTNATEADGLRFRPFAYAHMWLERHFLGDRFEINYWIGLGYIALSGTMLAFLLMTLGASARCSLAAAAIAVLHPAHSEVFGWASARIDTMAASFGLLAVTLNIRGRGIFATLAFSAALLSKESAYPLVVLPALFVLLRDRSLRATVRAAVPGLVAFTITIGLKLWLAGGFVADSWRRGIADISPLDRVMGYLSYADPLFLDPAAEISVEQHGPLLATLFTSLVMAGVLLAFTIGVIRHASLGLMIAANRKFQPALVVLACGAIASLLVTFGVPARSDFCGGRVWFLPALFLVGLLGFFARPMPFVLAALPAFFLLNENLLPYREANTRMRGVLHRLASVTHNRPKAAVRATGLPEWHGPVPLFALMPAYYHEVLPPPPAKIARAFLTTDFQAKANPQTVVALDREWRLEMRRQGNEIVDFTWQAEQAELQLVESPDK